MKVINVLSLGAGRQSSYMLIRGLEGAFKFKPDCAVFCDTGCEPSYVYSYLEWLTKYVWDKFNFKIIISSKSNLIDDTYSYISCNSKSGVSIPVYISPEGAPIKRQCTEYYKIRPVRKAIRIEYGKRPIRLWIGISSDEIERMRISSIAYINNYYPLVEQNISLKDIKKWYSDSLLPAPEKSSCKICPFHSKEYWLRLKEFYPDEFYEACKFDVAIRNLPNLSGQCFLLKSMKPLSSIERDTQITLFPELLEECEGMCGL